MTLNPRDMDGFMPLLSTSDIKTKMIIGNNLLTYLGDLNNSIECQDIGLFIDNVIPWLNNGNAKIVQNGLEILTQIADRMGHDFKPYISSIIQPTIDRLGDSKDLTREKARLVLLKILEKGSMIPQSLLDRIHPTFIHKNAKLREESLLLLTTILAEHGADSLSLSSVIPSIVKLLSDPNEKVRETAVNTVVNIYRHVGERFRNDLQRNHNLPSAKWQLLVEKFDQIRAEGDLFPHANAMDVGRDTDELDRVVRSAPAKKIKSVLPKKSQFGPSVKIPSIGNAGAVDEESFSNAFEDVPQVHLFSAKDLEEHFKTIRDTIGDDKKDWNQRIDHLKKIRGLVMAGGASYENFMELLKSIQNPFEGACTDLRSQVVKEATITLAYLSRQLKNKIAQFVEGLLGPVMNLIQNSAKVVSSSGAVALRFIFQHTHSARFIPILTAFFTSKSKDIRRAACEYVNLILQSWSTSLLQKHIKILQDAIGKGIGDPDAEARSHARKAFWAFRDHFPDQAEMLLNTMDASHKRNLLSQSNSGSVNSLNAVVRTPSIPPRSTRPTMSAAGSTENLHQTQSPPYGPLKRTPSLPRSYRQSGIPVLQRPTDNYCRVSPGPRSNSAIDLQAARRAQSRLKYANINRTKATTVRPVAKQVETNLFTSPERSARTKTRVSGVSQSQPSSRSCSPASRMSYASYSREGDSFIARPRRLSGQGMRSTETSRDPSPQRFGLDRSVSSKLRERNLYMSPRPPVMAQKMLQQSQAAESALADALTFDRDHHPKTPNRNKGDQSDDSETSSICSERSMENFRRPSDSFSWSGSQQRLYREAWDQSGPKDIKEIIEWCGRKQWGERKEGLMDLQQFLINGNTLTATELRQITDIFTKMFMDSHTKVFSLFLDTLNELIITHSEDLVDWLYVLCTRLLNKLGMDLLVSIQTKINRSLDVVKENFPSEQLLPVVMRFLTDPAHTPNSRVKVATLTFLTHIADNAEPSSLTPSCKSALVRLLDWTSDMKSQEVRRHASEAIIALYNLNPPLFPMLLNELPKMYQDTAMPLIQNHLKRSPASNPASPSGQLPRVPQSPARTVIRHDLESDDHLNPEEVYKSLRRTTAEIQNYGFERMEGATSSKDSGISNMADVEEKIESLTLSNSGRSSSVSSPTQRGRSVGSITVNGSSDTIAGDLILPDRRNNGYETHNVAGVSPELPRGPEVFERTLRLLQSSETQTLDKANVLRDFQIYIRDGDGAKYVITQFKKLLKTMLDCLALDDKSLEIEVLKTLIEMLKCRDLTNYFDDFADLLILKVLNEHKSDAYEGSSSSPRRGNSSAHCAKPLQLLKAAEDCAAMIAAVLPPHKTIHLALTTAKTEPFPKNVAAIKMIQNVVEHRGKDALGALIDDVMGTLMQAYENPESVVRKAAVFCMVAIHAAIGEESFNKYRKNLYGGKLKLLNIYIQKAQEAVQASSSPRSNNSKN
ncbi:CLIP-associating protein 1-A isoform X2 [Cotesia glomerata]|uniref:CLIP-associating protein 1-A isoform X2 n=1 Tax=Cotesia glomerata TaxID=32391 RepID=UPI001D00D0E4|nr:CLIP-associating protein 1-A isoform X2 [Cotesia glomerata]